MKNFTSIVFLMAINLASAQTCLHTNLSKTFDIETKRRKIKDAVGEMDSCLVTVTIKQKQTGKVLQTIRYSAGYLYSNVFRDCNDVRSYATHRNTSKEVIDYDFGDVVVADLNFDGKDDFAIKNDSGGNGGPFYNFYLQSKTGSFFIDHFLTDSMGLFPRYINAKNKTITTQIHANAREECRNTYQLITVANTWKQISQTFVK